MSRQRPEGPYTPIDDEWRARVRAALSDLGWTQARLAAEAGVTGGAISQALNNPEQKTSRVADAINEVLQIAPTGFSSMAAYRAFKKISDIEERDPKGFLDLIEKIDRQHANLDSSDK